MGKVGFLWELKVKASKRISPLVGRDPMEALLN